MLKKKLISGKDIQILNLAVEKELYASHHYHYGASCFQKQGLFGFQKLFEQEADDEVKHYRKLRDFANDVGVEVDMPSVGEVVFSDESVMGILMTSYELELNLKNQYVIDYQNCDDVSMKIFLQEMIEIQTKAVGEFADMIAKLEKYSVALFDMELNK